MMGWTMLALLMMGSAAAVGGQGADTDAGEAAEEQRAAQAASTRNGDEDMDRIVCRSPRPVLGSRIRTRRDCMTVAQWRAYDEARRGMQRDMTNHPDPLKTTNQ